MTATRPPGPGEAPWTPGLSAGPCAAERLKQAVAGALDTPGASAAALADLRSGECLTCVAAPGAGTDALLSVELLARQEARALRARLHLLADLPEPSGGGPGGPADAMAPSDTVDDLLLTTRLRYILVRFVPGRGCAGLFLCLMLDRATANLALARRRLAEVAGALPPVPPVLSVEAAEPRVPGVGGTEEIPPFLCEDTVLRLLGIPAAPAHAPDAVGGAQNAATR